MKPIHPVRAALSALVLPTALSLSAFCGAASATSSPVPFEAVLVINEGVNFTYSAPCFAIGTLNGTGVATHAGRLTGTSQDCINPVGAFNPNAPSFQFASYGPGVRFTAANGDQLFATYSGTLTYRAPLPHQISGHYVITGGTGKFTGATGGGILTGFEDISSMTAGYGVVTFTGTILFGCRNGGSSCSQGAGN